MTSEASRKAAMTFEEWCPIKITDANKAPKAVALVAAYRTAWQARDALAEQENMTLRKLLQEGINRIKNADGQLAMDNWRARADEVLKGE